MFNQLIRIGQLDLKEKFKFPNSNIVYIVIGRDERHSLVIYTIYNQPSDIYDIRKSHYVEPLGF